MTQTSEYPKASRLIVRNADIHWAAHLQILSWCSYSQQCKEVNTEKRLTANVTTSVCLLELNYVAPTITFYYLIF